MTDAKRCLYLVCYDVADPRRLRRVHRFLLGYKAGGQKSFFECWLTPAELRHLQDDLTRLLDAVTDRAHLFQLDPAQAVVYLRRAPAAVLRQRARGATRFTADQLSRR